MTKKCMWCGNLNLPELESVNGDSNHHVCRSHMVPLCNVGNDMRSMLQALYDSRSADYTNNVYDGTNDYQSGVSDEQCS